MLVAILATGCVSYRPHPTADVPFMDRAQRRDDGDVVVTVAVPDAAEAQRIFGVDLWSHRIQPVWLRVENRGAETIVLLKAGIDPSYYPPAEAARAAHFGTGTRVLAYGVGAVFLLPVLVPGAVDVWRAHAANGRMDDDFSDKGFSGTLVVPGTSEEGFVFTALDPGTKHVPVPLLSPAGRRQLDFYVAVAGIRADHARGELTERHGADQLVAVDDPEALRAALAALPCCTTDARGGRTGDPLNLVLVGDFPDLLHALRTARWDETEVIYAGSVWRTIRSFVAGSEYRVSPVSDLYVDGRKQDVAFQKTRSSIHQRHHFRLWTTPLRYQGRPVWIGAATRDIGVRFTTTTWNLTTHAIDADVDDARDYVVADLIEAHRAQAVGATPGVGVAEATNPRRTLTGDPWFTDGHRAVVLVAPDPVAAPPAILDLTP